MTDMLCFVVWEGVNVVVVAWHLNSGIFMGVQCGLCDGQGMTVMVRIGPGRRAHSGQGGGGAYTGSPGGLLQPV